MSKTVLYVEDNEFNRKIVRQLLTVTTYRLLEATDGEAGVAMAFDTQPDLVLMDIQLPKLSGLGHAEDPPGTGDDRKALEAGASAYLAKPYSPRQMLELIRKLAPDT